MEVLLSKALVEAEKEIETLRLELAVCRDTIKPYVENCSRLAADTIKQQEEIETLRSTVDQLTRTLAACCNARDLTADDRDEWKRRAFKVWDWMPSFVGVPEEIQQWFENEEG